MAECSHFGVWKFNCRWNTLWVLVQSIHIYSHFQGQPIRFKPINSTEFAEQKGQQGSKYRRKRRINPLTAIRHSIRRRRHRLHHLEAEWRHLELLNRGHKMRRSSTMFTAARAGHDDIFRQFPDIRRENPQMQRILVFLMENGTRKENRGFLHFYNSTTGEIVPSCDRHFTIRNAQVIDLYWIH